MSGKFAAIPWVALGITLATALGATAQAAESESDFSPAFEVTPMLGYRLGGSLDVEDSLGNETSADLGDGASFGLGLGVYRDQTSFVELLYSRKEAELDIDGAAAPHVDVTTEYFQLGGSLLFPGDTYFVPWMSLTIGAARLAPDGPYESETRFAGSLGGGVRLPINAQVSISLGLRGYLTLIDSDSSIFCTGSGDLNCLVKTTGSTYFEGEAVLGINFVF